MRTGLAAVFLAAAWTGTALGAPADSCAASQRGCLVQCDQAYPASSDDMGRAGCLARCSWDGAACAARRALDDTQATLERDVRPWLADQAGRWQRFLDGFRGAGAPPAEPPRARPPEPNPDRSTPL